ncbi:MAG: TIR domain-containing protein [Geobacter sp.]|nr:TIR domain-containing protein [Geobacter sp.]
MFTESQLKGFASSYTLNKSASQVFESASTAKTTMFLSHSHKDKELAKGLKNHLKSFGVNIYIDIEDSDMPGSTNRETAERIKGAITRLHYFLILATRNAMDSKWVPWEIGVADGKKPHDKILVVPVIDPTGKFHGSEYLQLYKRIDTANDGNSAIFEPNKTSGIYVKNWLASL